MNRKAVARKIFVYTFYIIVMFAFHLYFPRALCLKNVHPRFFLVLTVFVTHFFSLDEGIIVGVISGLIADIYLGPFIGMESIFYLCFALLTAFILKKYIKLDKAGVFIILTIVSILDSLARGIIVFIDNNRYGFQYFFLWWLQSKLFPTVVMNLAAGVLMYVLLKIINPLSKKDSDEYIVYVKPL